MLQLVSKSGGITSNWGPTVNHCYTKRKAVLAFWVMQQDINAKNHCSCRQNFGCFRSIWHMLSGENISCPDAWKAFASWRARFLVVSSEESSKAMGSIHCPTVLLRMPKNKMRHFSGTPRAIHLFFFNILENHRAHCIEKLHAPSLLMTETSLIYSHIT